MSIGMLFQLVSIVLCVLSAGACVAAVAWTIRRLQSGDIHQRALRKTAREAGVSERYLEEVLANNADFGERRISGKEWRRRAMQIAYRYPVDSKTGRNSAMNQRKKRRPPLIVALPTRHRTTRKLPRDQAAAAHDPIPRARALLICREPDSAPQKGAEDLLQS
jgi:hypothetical protein